MYHKSIDNLYKLINKAWLLFIPLIILASSLPGCDGGGGGVLT